VNEALHALIYQHLAISVTIMARLTTLLSLLAAASVVHSSVIPAPRTNTLPRNDDDNDTPLPLIIWHGLGDNYQADGLAAVAKLADDINPGTLVYLIHLDDDGGADKTATFLGNLTEQLDKVCEDLAAHPILSTAPAVDALGFSQGGQFLRGYIERCNFPPVRSLVTLGSQHNGISEFQRCGDGDWLCKGWQGLLRSNTWSAFVQSRVIPAQYYRDPNPDAYQRYLENSNFLADINNERAEKNPKYKENMEKLEKFVMYVFEDDEVVIPKDSSWFTEVNGTEVTLLKDRDLYKEDWLGLKTLDKKGALEFRSTPGGHMNILQTLLEDIFTGYYGPFGRKFSTSNIEHPFQQEL
jgi:palmitoyl-protein thioesterase